MSNTWNSTGFAIVGAIAGGAYVVLLCSLIGLSFMKMMSAVFIAVVIGAVAGACIFGGVAALRNLTIKRLPARI
jgi:hypothetical protein